MVKQLVTSENIHMTKEKRPEMGNDPVKMFGMMLPSLPTLLFRFGGVFLRFKSRANKGGRIFQKELMQHGLDKETSEKLKEIYVENADLIKLIQTLKQ